MHGDQRNILIASEPLNNNGQALLLKQMMVLYTEAIHLGVLEIMSRKKNIIIEMLNLIATISVRFIVIGSPGLCVKLILNAEVDVGVCKFPEFCIVSK